jgi:hypothetical protein
VASSLLNDMPYTEAREHLQAAWGGYHIWTVPLATGDHLFTWCGHRHSDGQHFQADSPDELNEMISKAEPS